MYFVLIEFCYFELHFDFFYLFF